MSKRDWKLLYQIHWCKMAATKRTSIAPASTTEKEANKLRLEKNESPLLRFYNALRYHVVPPFFVVLFTLAVQFLAKQANPDTPFHWDRYRMTRSFLNYLFISCSNQFLINNLKLIFRILGNAYSWKVVAIFLSWAMVIYHTLFTKYM